MGIKLKNFSIDWKEPFYLQAEVLESNALEQYVDIAVNPMTKTEFEGNRLGFVTNGLSLPFLGESMVFDPKTNAVAYNAQSYLLNGVASRKTFDQSLGGNNYRIKARFAKTPAPAGLIYVFKGPNRSNRLAPAIHLTNSSNLHLAHYQYSQPYQHQSLQAAQQKSRTGEMQASAGQQTGSVRFGEDNGYPEGSGIHD